MINGIDKRLEFGTKIFILIFICNDFAVSFLFKFMRVLKKNLQMSIFCF